VPPPFCSSPSKVSSFIILLFPLEEKEGAIIGTRAKVERIIGLLHVCQEKIRPNSTSALKLKGNPPLFSHGKILSPSERGFDVTGYTHIKCPA
jgi:hypothetical protein